MSRALLALEARPTAILMTGEMLSIGLYRGLIEAGVIPGRDIAVIGRDNPHARFLSPTLTSFRTSLRDLGIALAEALLATFPAYAEHYPVGTTRRLWPMTLTDGQSDLMQVPPQGALSPSLALKATKPI